jgi:hypothetical protein
MDALPADVCAVIATYLAEILDLYSLRCINHHWRASLHHPLVYRHFIVQMNPTLAKRAEETKNTIILQSMLHRAIISGLDIKWKHASSELVRIFKRRNKKKTPFVSYYAFDQRWKEVVDVLTPLAQHGHVHHKGLRKMKGVKNTVVFMFMEDYYDQGAERDKIKTDIIGTLHFFMDVLHIACQRVPTPYTPLHYAIMMGNKELIMILGKKMPKQEYEMSLFYTALETNQEILEMVMDLDLDTRVSVSKLNDYVANATTMNLVLHASNYLRSLKNRGYLCHTIQSLDICRISNADHQENLAATKLLIELGTPIDARVIFNATRVQPKFNGPQIMSLFIEKFSDTPEITDLAIRVVHLLREESYVQQELFFSIMTEKPSLHVFETLELLFKCKTMKKIGKLECANESNTLDVLTRVLDHFWIYHAAALSSLCDSDDCNLMGVACRELGLNIFTRPSLTSIAMKLMAWFIERDIVCMANGEVCNNYDIIKH